MSELSPDESDKTAADVVSTPADAPVGEHQNPVLTEQHRRVEVDQDPVGHVMAVWGPIGSPGVTTMAVNLAVESALAGYKTLLIDADTYGAAVAVHLGLLDDTAAIAQACRAAEHHGIDAYSLAKFTQHVAVGEAHVDVCHRSDSS